MLRFVGGFLVASLFWGGAAFYLHKQGDLFPADIEPPSTDAQPALAEQTDRKPRRGRRRRRGANAETRRGDDATQTVGEDIGWDSQQGVDMAGGEQQLSGSQIEAGFDSAMPGIRRCLVLVPADGEISGTLSFGMRVASSGSPTAVNLTGPAVVTAGEAGDCLRRVARSIRFEPFQGPDTVFKYPITLQ